MANPGGDRVRLPADNHVHTQWSWDAPRGSMELTCARAVELGLPSVAFTEHADLTAWTFPPGAPVPDDWRHLLTGDLLTPPPLDLDGYRACLEQCRARHPGLRILSGVELGEPHWHVDQAGSLLADGGFERVLASVHTVRSTTGSTLVEVSARHDDRAPDQLVRDYLAETAQLVATYDAFEVLAHIDYPVRSWPADAPPYDPHDFEEEYRHVLRLLAAGGRALEVNTRVPLHPEVLGWWHQEGGRTITFASDAHDPAALARGFADAVHLAEAAGFRPGHDPLDFWGRA